MKAILAKKVGMTQIFKDDKAIPVTVLEAGPCFVTQVKTEEKDGYEAIQLGFLPARKIRKPQEGHLKGLEKLRHLREFRIGELEKTPVAVEIKEEGEPTDEKEVQKGIEIAKKGEKVTVDMFSEGDVVQVSGISKGRGFQGVVKRHGFKTGPMAHGSDHHREPGSIGSTYPQRVIKGKKMPGHYGVDKVTVKNLKVVSVDAANNILAISGAVPGANGGLVIVMGDKER